MTLRRSPYPVDSRLFDALVAVGLTVWACLEPGALDDGPRALVRIAMTVVIAWRSRAPVAVLAAEVAGVVLLPSGLQWPQGVALLIAAFSASLYSDRRAPVPALLLVAAVWFLAFGNEVQIPHGLVPFLLIAPPWLAGTAMRHHELRAEAATARAAVLELEREASLRAERARIARELHDVVTHSVSVMVMQTGAARQIMNHDGDRSRALLESAEASGRTALGELRRLLGLLSDDQEDAPLAPQPGVAEIPSLVDQVRDAGVLVELSVEGEPRAVSQGVALAAYRIVQEGLTNVLKHAAGAPTRVVLRWGSAELELEILDVGAVQAVGAARAARPAEDPDAAPGRGLAGMRERAAMYGGTLDARSEPDGGYAIRARIPLQPECP